MARAKKTRRASATDAINATIDKHEAKAKRPRKSTAKAVAARVAEDRRDAAAAHVTKPWPETFATKEVSSAAARARIEAAHKYIDTLLLDDSVEFDEYKLAVTCTCSSCSADVGELCVTNTRGTTAPKIKTMPCRERVEAATKAAEFIARKMGAASREVAPKDAGGRAERNVQSGAPVADVRGRLPDGVSVWIAWPGSRERAGGGPVEHHLDRPGKRAQLVRYNENGRPVVRVFAVDAKGVYTGALGAEERTIDVAELVGPTGTMGPHDPMGLEFERTNREAILAMAPRPPDGLTIVEESVDGRTKRVRKPPAPETIFIRCWKAGCPAEYDANKSMPPDWAVLYSGAWQGGKSHCPVHAREAVSAGTAGRVVSRRCNSPLGCANEFSFDAGAPSAPPGWGVDNDGTWRCPSHASSAAATTHGGASFGRPPEWSIGLERAEAGQLGPCAVALGRWPRDFAELRAWMLEHGKEWSRVPATSPPQAPRKDTARTLADLPAVSPAEAHALATRPPAPPDHPLVTMAMHDTPPARGLNAPAATMCAHRDDAGKCVRSFHGVNPSRGWVRVDDPLDVMKSAFFCPQHKASPCREDIHFCPADGCDAHCFGAYPMAGWTKVDHGGAKPDMWCPRHGHARDAAAIAAQPPRIGAPPLPPKLGERGSPHHRDTSGSCGACDRTFKGGMPPKWEWWKGNFWCPEHVPAELRQGAVDLAAANAMPNALDPALGDASDPWDETSPSAHETAPHDNESVEERAPWE